MNDQQILSFVVTNPKVRAVEVANKFDVDLEDARNALQALCDVGDLIESDGFSPQGHPAKVYEVSRQWKKLETSPAEAPNTMEPGAAPTTAPGTEPEELPRTERALKFLNECGATGSDSATLRDVMGLDRRQHPQGYLRYQLSSGKLVSRNGRYYAAEFAPGRNEQGKIDWKQKPTAAPTQAPAKPQPKTAPTTTRFRYGMWSDGTFEMQREAESVCAMTRAEAVALRDYLNKALQELATA